MLPEFDSPGHAKAMCAGAPPGVCMPNCTASANWPLRLSDASFAFLEQARARTFQNVPPIAPLPSPLGTSPHLSS